MFDKERLQGQAFGLKLQLNTLHDENLKLRTQCLIYENDLKRAEKLISDISIPQSSNRTSLKKDSLLVMNLKSTIKDLQHKLTLKDNDIFALKQNIKLTSNAELEAESKVYYNECIRLRSIVDTYFISKGIDPNSINEMGTML